MTNISQELQDQIQLRIERGPYRDTEELLRIALAALDHLRDENGAPPLYAEDDLYGFETEEELVAELMKGMEGEDIEVTPEFWADVRQETLQTLADKNRL